MSNGSFIQFEPRDCPYHLTGFGLTGHLFQCTSSRFAFAVGYRLVDHLPYYGRLSGFGVAHYGRPIFVEGGLIVADLINEGFVVEADLLWYYLNHVVLVFCHVMLQATRNVCKWWLLGPLGLV